MSVDRGTLGSLHMQRMVVEQHCRGGEGRGKGRGLRHGRVPEAIHKT